MKVRPLTNDDLPALREAIGKDIYHSPEDRWEDSHFTDPQVLPRIVEDARGPVVFYRLSKTLRISCVWADPENMGRNVRAILTGMKDTIEQAVQSGYKEIIVTTNHPPLAEFLKRFGFSHANEEYILSLS
jgi:N-acetylglutamate synthase-like GNAT family acetyltransferase